MASEQRYDNLALLNLMEPSPGIGGEKCDECAVGFVHKMPLTSDHPVNTRIIPSGQTPNCQPCGECFDNWNRILNGE